MSFALLLMEGLTPEMERTSERELGETPSVKKESLDKIKKLIEQEPDFHPFLDDKFLLMFLRCKKYDVQRAFKTLQNFYLFKEKYSRVFTDFLPSELKGTMDKNCYTNMPLRDSYGRTIIIFRIGQLKEKQISIEELFAATMTLGIFVNRIEASSVCGCVIIFDFAGFSLEQIFKFASPKFVTFMFNSIQDCLPYRIRSMHVVNEPALFSIFYNIVKFAIPSKLKDRIFVHGKNLEELQKHFPPEILPEELGGTTGPMDSSEFYNYALNHESLIEEMIKCQFQRKASRKSEL